MRILLLFIVQLWLGTALRTTLHKHEASVADLAGDERPDGGKHVKRRRTPEDAHRGRRGSGRGRRGSGRGGRGTGRGKDRKAKDSKQCKSYCAKSKQAWVEKCSWENKCDDCKKCKESKKPPVVESDPGDDVAAYPVILEQAGVCNPYCRTQEKKRSWTKKCEWIGKCDGCTECDNENKVELTHPVPIKGEVFLDDGWKELPMKDFRQHAAHLGRGDKEFTLMSRTQVYDIKYDSPERGSQINRASQMVRTLRFYYEEGALPKVDEAEANPEAQASGLAGLVSDDVLKLIMDLKETKEANSDSGDEAGPITKEDVARFFEEKETGRDQESNESMAVALCQDGGIARSGAMFGRDGREGMGIFLACHDDQGRGLDLCFYNGIGSMCRQSVHHLMAYRISAEGEFEVSFKNSYQASLKTVLKGVIEDGKLLDDEFIVIDTNDLDDDAEPEERSYHLDPSQDSEGPDLR